jgi:PKHD-type hydroxylase
MEINASYLHLSQLLSGEQLQQINELSKQAAYLDGKSTASSAAKLVKHNLQMDAQSQPYAMAQQIILGALNQSSLFREATFIKNIYPFLLSKYTQGMEYGWHVDSPLMGNMMRTDIAITIYLNNPDEYDGGELELQTPLGNQLYKLAAGDALCYPCTQVHRVRPVTKGQRLVAVSWIESMVKSTEERKILFEMQQTIEGLLQTAAKEESNKLQQIRSNLIRMWAQ